MDVETATLDEAVRRLRARAEAAPAGAWIQGSGWNHNVWGAGALPDRGPLDRAAPRNPVALKAKSGHAIWANGLALQAAGIHAGTADPPGGKIVRGAAGEPTGMLLENAMDLVQAAIPAPTTEQMADALLDAQSALHRVGLVGAYDYDSSLVLGALELLEQRGQLSLRVVKGIPHELLSQAIALGLRTGFGGERLTIGAVKLFADGALGPQTAWMLEPYEGGSSLGIPTLTEDLMFEDARRANAAGIACAIHAIGDGACRAVLNAFERASGELGHSAEARQLRNRMEHAQLLSPDDLPRMARLGVIASMQPIHATSDMLIADRYWGDRCAGAYAWRSLLEAGTTLSFGSDC
ncbi:MAG TPA: amidohydrolase, partial [bacterium]|nr:amidohydrolase [bacterium]